MEESWFKGFPGGVTVCDKDGLILEMNEKACKIFEKQGGEKLIGGNVMDCHPGPARAKLKELMDREGVNAYTIEKNNVKKLIYQAPWYHEGKCGGIVELSLELPENMPHFIRT
ncbi:MAG TPA: PAS domain-containing protein, partial [Chroococcales cyanobacterium]